MSEHGDIIERQTILYLCDMHNILHITQSSSPKSFLTYMDSVHVMNTVMLVVILLWDKWLKHFSEKNPKHKEKLHLNYELIVLWNIA